VVDHAAVAERVGEQRQLVLPVGETLQLLNGDEARLDPQFLVVTDADVEALLAAWPGILDAAYEEGN